MSMLNSYKESELYKSLEIDCKEKNHNCIIANLGDIIKDSINLSKTILSNMNHYTLHDEIHQLKVLDIMERILTIKNIKKLNIPEKFILIVLAFTHDLGMSPEKEKIDIWKKCFDTETNLTEEIKTNQSFIKFKEFKEEHRIKEDEYNKAIDCENYSQAGILKEFIISEYIRETHAKRSEKFIREKFKDKLKYNNIDLTDIICSLILNHVHEGNLLLDNNKFDLRFPCGQDIEICTPLLGIIFRLADILDFDSERTPEILFNHIFYNQNNSNGNENIYKNSKKEWNKHRSIQNLTVNETEIKIVANCSHPAIQKSILEFCGYIDDELENSNNVLSKLNENQYYKIRDINIKIPFKIIRDYIKPENENGQPKYYYQDIIFNLSKNKILEYLLGSKLYNDPTACLRELVQNSKDACLLRDALEKKSGSNYKPTIEIKYYNDNDIYYLEVNDNGIGMDENILKKYYTNIGESYYKSSDFNKFKNDTNANFTPTSRFGIGILSVFMISNFIQVETKRLIEQYKYSDPLLINIEGFNSIFELKKGTLNEVGTKTKLTLNNNPWNQIKNDEVFKEQVWDIFPNLNINLIINTNLIKKNEEQEIPDKCNQHSFDLDTRFLKFKKQIYKWDQIDNLEILELDLNETKKGYKGKVLMAIIVENKLPILETTNREEEIDIDNKKYKLKTILEYSFNKVMQNIDTITIDIDKNIIVEPIIYDRCLSKSNVTLHGITVENKLFEEYEFLDYNKKIKQKKVSLNWVFPVAIIVDINEDLALNAARTEFELNPKWDKFEINLIQDIFNKIKELKGMKYYNKLIEIGLSLTKNNNFKKALESLSKNIQKQENTSNIEDLPF